jgi:DNA-directed RNA polymerase subunit M/transcription elongation factor TFIIS
MFLEKSEFCPDCSKSLDQDEYDMQFCRACGKGGSFRKRKVKMDSTALSSANDGRVVNNSDNTVRHNYRVLSDEEKANMVALKDKGLEFINICRAIGVSREMSLAITKAEEAVMWAVKHITA